MANQRVEDERSESDNPPAGFEAARSRSLYSQRNGPYYFRLEADCFRQGVRIRQKHCNGSGVAHGGMLSSVADNAMAGAVYGRLGVRSLTIQMNMQFMAVVKPGDWLEGIGRVRRITQTLVFCDAELFAGEDRHEGRHEGRHMVMRASGIFRRGRVKKASGVGGQS